jgi:protein-S-isoprenylcysteine O-methyltransferase Ste14
MKAPSTARLESRIHGNTARVLAVTALAIFLSAGTLRYWEGCLYLLLQALTMTVTNLYLLRHDRALLERRLAVVEEGETQRVHKVFFALLRPLVLAMLVLSGLDHRFGWSSVPLLVVVVGSVAFVAGCVVVFMVFRENSHASSVIEIVPEQRVVATGPYRSVRHPLYSSALLGALATPLALGSYVGEAFFLPVLVLFVVRLLAEERFLSGALRGYDDYMRRTRKRLVPGVW